MVNEFNGFKSQLDDLRWNSGALLHDKCVEKMEGCEISSLLDEKLVKWSTASCALALVCWPSVSNK